jgi:hypothetical protein
MQFIPPLFSPAFAGVFLYGKDEGRRMKDEVKPA